MKIVLCSFGLGVSLLLLLTNGAAAADWYVATNGSDSTGAGSLANPYLTISNAAAQASNTDTIIVSNGTYLVTAPISITSAKALTVRSFTSNRTDTIVDGGGISSCFSVSNSAAVVAHMTIRNGYSAANGGGLYVFYGLVSNCLIMGNSAGTGGGVRLERATLKNCWISENTATNGGGGVYNGSFNAQIKDCVISNNTVLAGGAAGIWLNGESVMSDCTIVGNTNWGNYGAAYLRGNTTACIFSNNISSGNGGAIYITSGEISNSVIVGNTCQKNGGGVQFSGGGTLRNCTIQNNLALTNGGGINFSSGGLVTGCVIIGNSSGGDDYGGGGGVYFSASGLLIDSTLASNVAINAKYGGGACFFTGGRIVSCILDGNTATNGGGAYVNRGGAITNCLIVGNVATNGGGMYLTHSFEAVTNAISFCTIAGNHAERQGGGAWLDGTNNLIGNTIVWSNTAGIGNGDVYHNATACTNIYFYSCASTNLPVLQGNISANPGFADATNGNWRLGGGSPCIDAGLNQNWMIGAVDLDGYPRINRITGRVDIGAYEWIPTIFLFQTH